MLGLVYLKECLEDKSSFRSKLTIVPIQGISSNEEDSIPKVFSKEMGGCKIKGFDHRLDPFQKKCRVQKTEYGLLYVNVKYRCNDNTQQYSGPLFALSYVKKDLLKFIAEDGILKKLKYTEENELQLSKTGGKQIPSPQRSALVCIPTAKKPKIMFSSQADFDVNNLSFDENADTGKELAGPSSKLTTTLSHRDSQIEVSEHFKKLIEGQERILKQNEDLMERLKNAERTIADMKVMMEGNKYSTGLSNIIELRDGFAVTRTAYEEACRHRLVQKAALPLFESLFTSEEKSRMRMKAKEGQESVDFGRLNAIYKTVAALPNINRLAHSDPNNLSEAEQRLVRQEIGSLLNQKRQREKKRENAESLVSVSGEYDENK